MRTVLLAHDSEFDAPWARRCRLRDRLRARLRSLSLDRELAAGASPDSDLLLSLRAQAMIGMTNRRELASALRRVVADAGRPMGPMGPSLPLARRAIRRHCEVIHQLAGLLDRTGPLGVRGLAAVEVLLKDGAGPLYCYYEHDALGPQLHAALEALSAPPVGFTLS